MKTGSVRIEIRDNNGVLKTYVDNIVTAASWEWNRIGGCGVANITIRDSYDAVSSAFGEDYEARIYLPDSNNIPILWYSGYIDRISPRVEGGQESVGISLLGYVNYIKRAIVKDKNYYGMELSLIAKDIIDTYVVPVSAITSTAADYSDINFTADDLYFNESAYACLAKLAAISGKVEWGVRADKSFFFKLRNDGITRYFHIKENFSSFSPMRDYGQIITGIYLEGGEGYKAKFQVTNKVSTREEIVNNSSIITQSVGQQFARSYLKEKGAINRSYSGTIPNFTGQVEGTIPIGKAAINMRIGITDKYDSGILYNSGKKYDGGTESFQIERVVYTLKDYGIAAQLSFGSVAQNISDELGRLEYLINARGNQ